jgi:hypothetical protein
VTIELMQGAAAAKRFVNEYLQRDLPSRLVTYRNGWNLDDESLPDPLEYLTFEPVGLDTWPTIISVAISTNNMERIDYGESYDPIYRVQYSMRTYIWARGDTALEADATRDNLTTVVRSALLDHQCLSHADTGTRNAIIDEGSIREEFSELTLLKGDRVLAGAYIAYNINLDEVVARASTGTIEEIRVETWSSL